MDGCNANASLNEVNIIANYDLLQMWFQNNSVRIVRAFLAKEDPITKQSGRFDKRRKLGKRTTAAVVTTGQRRSCCGTHMQSPVLRAAIRPQKLRRRLAP
jgi:hypothetical protein